MSQMMPPGPPQGAPQGLPPGLMDLIAAHQAGQAGADPLAPDHESPEVAAKEVALIQQMIQLGTQYQAIQPDAEHKATMAKVLTILHQYMASEQKDAEAALGGGPGTRLLRRLGT